jgi:hypothetical protein
MRRRTLMSEAANARYRRAKEACATGNNTVISIIGEIGVDRDFCDIEQLNLFE